MFPKPSLTQNTAKVPVSPPRFLLNKRTQLMSLLVGFIILSLIILLWNRGRASTDWKPFAEVMGEQEARYWSTKLVEKYYARPVSSRARYPNESSFAQRLEEKPSRLRVKPITALKRRFYLIDFNNPSELCGYLGCLYALYSQEGEELLSVYLKELPDDSNFVLTVENSSSHYPDILISQWVEPNTQETFHYVYSDGQYVQLNSTRREG